MTYHITKLSQNAEAVYGYKGFKRELKPRADNQMHLTGMTISKEAGSLLFWSIKMCVKTMPMRLNISNDINNLGKVIR